MIEDWQYGGPQEECGVFGIFAPGRDVARLTFFGLYALQHRGQESAGIATSDGNVTYLHKGMGLVSQVFNETNLKPLEGYLAIGHNRYSTTGASHLRNASPYLIETVHGPLGVAHNGNLTNALELRQELLERGVGLASTTDSEVITQMLASKADSWAEGHPAHLDNWERRLWSMMHVAEGAYSLIVLTRNAIYAMRDSLGLRPLCIGELNGGGYVVASESCALMTIGAEFVREVEPGEIVRINASGLRSTQAATANKRALCIFEYVYFARPDSMFEGQTIHDVRQRMGRQLGLEAPADADIVIPVPDSAFPAAIGYSDMTGIPFSEGLTKNRYIGRTFIQPDDELRRSSVRLKYNPLTANLEGKRVVLVDDSIVRGNTAGPIVQLLRDGGAAEVHVRVSSPPVRHPCFMGIDMATYSQLVAAKYDIEGIRSRIGADSLAYLSLPGMESAVRETLNGTRPHGHCTACFSGEYPLNVPNWLFEEDRARLFISVAQA
ncbi:MAG: amidophosphoribosyltransferase [Anaerolineae bacterium]|nr:amidophosphoribosyltransferase [Anaerolineae bacterium]MCO5193867.1 amidophosphoribosyltransferase [Anaerolineae bacterium]MCO5197974.1 amidophosphoribosyltransferase [Anaerolineae bacterium]MCO5206162.1 amidophosphoribosyltransferase [Anaerolineae bacterium]